MKITRQLAAIVVAQLLVTVAAAQTSGGGIPANPKFNSVDIGTAVTNVAGRLTLSETVRQNGTGQNIFVGTVRSNNIAGFNLTNNSGSYIGFEDGSTYGLIGRSNQILGSGSDFAVVANAAGRDLFLGLGTSTDDFGGRLQSDKSTIDWRSPVWRYYPNSGTSTSYLYSDGTNAFCKTMSAGVLTIGLSGSNNNCSSITANFTASSSLTELISADDLNLTGGGGLGDTAAVSASAITITSSGEDISITSAAGINLTTSADVLDVRADTVAITNSAGGNTATVTINGQAVCLADGTNCLATGVTYGNWTATATGMDSTITADATWSRVGDQVCVSIEQLSGTSNDTVFGITGLPAAAFPVLSGRTTLFDARDNGVQAIAVATFFDDGSILLSRFTSVTAIATWTNSGSKQAGRISHCYKGA